MQTTATYPLMQWSDRERKRHFRSTFVGGWLRSRPSLIGVVLITAITHENPATREELIEEVRTSAHPDTPHGPSLWKDPSCLDTEEIAEQLCQRGEADRYAAHYGLPPLMTINGVIELLLAARVLYEIRDALGVLRLHPAHPVPPISDVLPVGDGSDG